MRIREWVKHTDEVINLQLELKFAIENKEREKIEVIKKKLQEVEIKQTQKYINKEVD